MRTKRNETGRYDTYFHSLFVIFDDSVRQQQGHTKDCSLAALGGLRGYTTFEAVEDIWLTAFFEGVGSGVFKSRARENAECWVPSE